MFSGNSTLSAFFQPKTKLQILEKAPESELERSEILDIAGIADDADPSVTGQFDSFDLNLITLSTDDVSDIDEDDESAADKDVLGPRAEGPDVSGLIQKDVPGPSDLSQAPDDGPRQTYLRTYPGHTVGNVVRRFQYKWFKMYEWLEYSKIADSAFCFCCRHFSMTSQRDRHQGCFTGSGFRAWNRGAGTDPKFNAFLVHKNSDEHRSSIERYEAYRTMSATGRTVVDMLDSEHKKQV
jgi:hypothetical protein